MENSEVSEVFFKFSLAGTRWKLNLKKTSEFHNCQFWRGFGVVRTEMLKLQFCQNVELYDNLGFFVILVPVRVGCVMPN